MMSIVLQRFVLFFFSSRRRHTRSDRDWSSDVCSSDLVITVASVEAAPVATLGPQIERHARFPQRVNAGFVEIVARALVRLRVYERGAEIGRASCRERV